MSYNRKTDDRKKRHTAPKDKVKNVETSSRCNDRQKLKTGKWDV